MISKLTETELKNRITLARQELYYIAHILCHECINLNELDQAKVLIAKIKRWRIMLDKLELMRGEDEKQDDHALSEPI